MDRSHAHNDTPIDLCGDLTDFFLEVVEAVKQRRSYSTTSSAAAYIAALLADHAHQEPVGPDADKPLTLQLANALTLVGTERFERLRQVGDHVLYTTGFFGEHLESRGIHQRYVEELGARAYATAGQMMMSDRRDHDSVFAELSEHFHMFVSWVHEVSELLRVNAARTERALLDLYERWLASGSEDLAAALALRGLVPVRRGSSIH